MHSDADFLAAQAAEPGWALARLVYADWLDERQDPRAELIRLEEQMREWPPFADEYWQAKPHRDELRRRFDPAWVRSLGYGTAVPPTFHHGIPSEPRLRWRLLRELFERCSGRAMPDVGGNRALLTQLEANWRDPLPEAIQHFVAFAADLAAHNEPGPFADITDFTRQYDLEYVWLFPFEDDQGGNYLGIRRSDWLLPDPPLVALAVLEEEDDMMTFGDAQPDTPPGTLSEWVLSWLLEHRYGSAWGDRVDLEHTRTALREVFGRPVLVSLSAESEDEVFENVDILFRLEERPDGSGLLHALARPPAAGLVRRFLPAELSDLGYRGGVFLPPGLQDEWEDRRRLSKEEIQWAAESRVREAFPGLRATADLPAAGYWLRVTADFGSDEAAFGVCKFYEAQLLTLSQEDATRYFHQACKTRRAWLCCLVAMFHLLGQRLPKDDAAALVLLNRAEELGDAIYAIHEILLGVCYRDGLGVPVDLKKAGKYFSSAAGGRPHTLAGEEFIALGEGKPGRSLAQICQYYMPRLLQQLGELPGDRSGPSNRNASRTSTTKGDVSGWKK